jgi:DNA-nicking Smr family endonuclease
MKFKGMKTKEEGFEFRPFALLRDLIKSKKMKVGSLLKEKACPPDQPKNKGDHDSENLEAFQDAMKGVKPIEHSDSSWKHEIPHIPPRPKLTPDLEAQLALQDLVKGGGKFRISDTPEYMEGIAIGVSYELVRRLHQGEFSVQARLDLHGFTVKQAEEKINAFLLDSLYHGYRCVMIVHGRGLSSPEYPKLKEKTRELLTRGHWSKWVIAFTSARMCDGGTGASYVLLRKKPVKKIKKSL